MSGMPCWSGWDILGWSKVLQCPSSRFGELDPITNGLASLRVISKGHDPSGPMILIQTVMALTYIFKLLILRTT